MNDQPEDRDHDLVAEEEAAAAAEAAEIGGPPTASACRGRAAARRGRRGRGGGVRAAEQQLVQSASHGGKRGHPLGDGFPEEDPRSEGPYDPRRCGSREGIREEDSDD